MPVRMMISLGVASSALIAATPALAQQEMTYEDRVYEYAQPVVQGEVPRDLPVVFQSDPVVQPIAESAPVVWEEEAAQPVRTVRYIKGPAHQAAPVQTHDVEYVETVAAAPHPVQHHPVGATRYVQAAPQMHHAAPHPQAHPQHHAAPVYAPPAYAPAQHRAGYDREAWLDECRDRTRGRRRGSNGGIIGGLLGAVAGGVIGNRVYDSERLAGTLIGAGVGGLAGLAIGSVISGSGDRRDRGRDECEDYLTRWEYQQQHGYHGGYVYQQAYRMVPVTVAIPQRAIVREEITTEIVTEYVEVETIEPVRRRVIPRPAPVPIKRQRYIKGQ